MGRLYLINLEGRIYSCKHCKTHLALYEDIVSKSFHCRHGKAYLFSKVVNISVGEKEERMMMTGMHTVADIFCVGCGSIVGWKYEVAHEKSQKYKEGKFILESYVPVTSFQFTARRLRKDSSFPHPKFAENEMAMVFQSWRSIYASAMGIWPAKFEISGPDGNNYWVSHEAQVGGSDADDA